MQMRIDDSEAAYEIVTKGSEPLIVLKKKKKREEKAEYPIVGIKVACRFSGVDEILKLLFIFTLSPDETVVFKVH